MKMVRCDYYHGDHLGSSSWITDASGNVNQHLAYMAYGEDFVNERSNRDIRFKFTSKEHDAETGMDYFGARYYLSDLSIWASVDPLAGTHPDYTPYAYCYNNPIIFMDPLGLDTIPFNKYGEFGKPIPADNGDKDVYVKVSKKEFKNNKINYKKDRSLRKRHKNTTISKDFRKSQTSDFGDDSHEYKIEDYKEAKRVFEFFANNTIVEWGHMILQDGK